MKNSPIGVFDSGLGGLTVAGEIARALPDESILYVGDTARCPYGPRDLDEVREFVVEICSWLEQQGVKLIVIACNTATAAGLALAQEKFNVPVIGVVEPGSRAAVRATRNRRVGVIGTVGTIESGVYSRAVRTIDAGVTVFSTATPRFVEMVEEGLRLDTGTIEGWLAQSTGVFIRPTFQEIARDYLDPIKRCGVDTLILGCTHYPLLLPLIGGIMGDGVELISSAEETAREVTETLERRGHLAEKGSGASHRFLTTSDPEKFASLGTRVLGAPLEHVENLTVSELIEAKRSRIESPQDTPAPSCGYPAP